MAESDPFASTERTKVLSDDVIPVDSEGNGNDVEKVSLTRTRLDLAPFHMCSATVPFCFILMDGPSEIHLEVTCDAAVSRWVGPIVDCPGGCP